MIVDSEIKERAKIFAAIDKLIELKNQGIQPKENLSKHLDDGIFELRVRFANRISRSLYFYESGPHFLTFLPAKHAKHAKKGTTKFFFWRISRISRAKRKKMLGTEESGQQIILTHGFIKKTQKTPKREIEKARTIRHAWRDAL